MYLLRELTEMSLPRIGNDLGGRDHTTVMHAVRKGERADGGASDDFQPGY